MGSITPPSSGVTYWLEAVGQITLKGPIPHFEFTEEFIIIIIEVLTKITIKHKTMTKMRSKIKLYY